MGRVSSQSVERVSNRIPYLLLLLLGVCCLSMATCLQPRAMQFSQSGQDSVLKVLMGDGRRLFANHFFTKADIYFHSGYYPSIFDRNDNHHESHMKAHEDHDSDEDERKEDFLGKPRDPIEAFSRHFMVTRHTHLEHGQEREILPWLKLSAELDPQLIDTYTVGAFWLAYHLGKTQEAEDFLREGLRANPKSYELLFSLGRIAYEKEHDTVKARNIWQLALRRWNETEAGKEKPDNLALEEITVNLGRLEENERNYPLAIQYLEQGKKVSPNPAMLEKQIQELKRKVAVK
jgi:tetratricopeptide (TPR) repeat protein